MWTRAQVEALAPDAGSLPAARSMTDRRKWQGLGQSPQALWGMVQGSGKQPYQSQVDLNGPAFRCSCPSRKFPCKHCLGLMLLWNLDPKALPEAEAPGWVRDWIAGREKKKAPAVPSGDKAPDLEAQAKRAAQRHGRVVEGAEFLRVWLSDLMRGGLSAAPVLPDSNWELAAARLIDCQAPGLARQIRRIPEILARPPWQEALLEHLGRIHLLLEAFSRLDTLPPDMQAEVRARIGWTQSQEAVLASEGVADRWWVVGQRLFDDEQVRTLRTWLRGERSERNALVLEFAVGDRPLPATFLLGSAFQGEMAFFPGVFPLRALVKSRADMQFGEPRGEVDFLVGYAAALAANPWLDAYPVLLEGARPSASGAGVLDTAGRELLFLPSFSEFWQVAAVSGGAPVRLFGEWDGRFLRPLTMWEGGRIYRLGGVAQ